MNHRMLRRIMKERHITQDSLAQSIGIDRTTLNRKLNGLRSFQLWEVEQLGCSLHLSGDEMLRIFFERIVA